MKTAILILSIATCMLTTSANAADGNPKRGAQVYRACVACHALELGLHLSGPSLGGVLGRIAGTADGYVRYSPGLKEAAFVWNAAALEGWLKNPKGMIPGTYMMFEGINDVQSLADLIAFLEIAGTPDGAKKAVADGLFPVSWLKAGAPDSVRDVPPEMRVASIRHCGDSYFIKTENGRERPYWEKNVRLKIDSVETGPAPGQSVIVGSGMRGDRVSVIFSNLDHLKSFIEDEC